MKSKVAWLIFIFFLFNIVFFFTCYFKASLDDLPDDFGVFLGKWSSEEFSKLLYERNGDLSE